jgi:thioredoxin-related protein
MKATTTFARRLFRFALAVSVVLAVSPAAAAELVMFERDGCVWCARWDREVGQIYPKTPEGAAAPLRRVNLDRGSAAESGLKAPVRFTPTFVLLDNGREIARIIGYMGEDAFWGLLGKYLTTAYKAGF